MGPLNCSFEIHGKAWGMPLYYQGSYYCSSVSRAAAADTVLPVAKAVPYYHSQWVKITQKSLIGQLVGKFKIFVLV